MHHQKDKCTYCLKPDFIADFFTPLKGKEMRSEWKWTEVSFPIQFTSVNRNYWIINWFFLIIQFFIATVRFTSMNPKLVVRRTLAFSRTSARDSAKLFGSTETYFKIFDRTKIRPNRIFNVQYQMIRPNLLISYFQFFLLQIFFIKVKQS